MRLNFFKAKFFGAYLFGQQTNVLGGAGYPVGAYNFPTGRKRKRRIDDDIRDAIESAYREITEVAPIVVQKQAAQIVKPFLEKPAESAILPPTSAIDWAELARNTAKVRELLDLWQKQIEDDEDILLLMAA